ncbi:uncharacterized protein CCDC7 [Liasis olivaceus]
MNATKQIKQNPVDISSPGTKKKGGYSRYGAEPMVLLPADTSETVTQYSLSLSSGNKDRMFDEMEMLRNITKHLNEIVHTMESVYIMEGEIKHKEEEEEEEEEEPPEEYEDMTSFLVCCSQLRTQLENALREEKQILESLLKWFEKEVHEMEEIGEEKILPGWEIPLADKSITNNINQLLNRIQRLEELKGRVQELPKLIQLSTPKQEKKKAVSPTPPTQKDPKNIIEELAMKHATEDVMNMVQVFQDETGQPQTVEMMNNRMIEIMKVFERQTNKLHRVVNEQDVLEGKLQKIQQEFRKLAEEKEIMEDELQKMKPVEQEKRISDSRKKMLPKLEKVKIEEKPQVSSEKTQGAQKPESVSVKQREHLKMKEDLTKAQEDIQSLQEEKKMLEEKLQKALQEVEKAKIQLAEIPPTIPDWQFPTSTVEEEVPKKGKRVSKGKVKGDDLKEISINGTEKTIPKLQRADTGKTSEVLPQKSQELVKQKGPAGVMEKFPKQTSQSEDTDKKMEESKKIKAEMVDSKGVSKLKESSEMKKRRTKGAGKDTSIQEKQQLPDSAKDEEKVLPVILDKPVEILPPDSKRRGKEITISPQLTMEERVPSTEQKTLPVIPELKVSAEFKPLTLQKEIPRLDIDSVGLKKEEKSHPLISKSMVQLADHLTELKRMPEAEILAKLLLEPDEGKLPEKQKLELLQILNQLVTTDELQQAGETEEVEEKRTLFANIESVVRLLQQKQPTEAKLSEEEINDLAEERTILLSILDSHLKDYQQVQAVIQKEQEIEREIKKLSEERTQLLAHLELNMKDLEQARALASTQPSEMNENKVKELEKQRALLADNLEANLQELQNARSFEEKKIDKLTKQNQLLFASLKSNAEELEKAEALAATHPSNITEEELHELRELSEKKQQLLKTLESNQKELQEIQELATIPPGSVTEHKMQELTEQRRRLTIDLEATLGGIQNVCRRASDRTTFICPSEKELYDLHELSEKKQQLLGTLESNWRELQEVQELAATQPSDATAHKLQELTEQRRCLSTNLEATLEDIQNVCRRASERTTFIPPSEKEVHELHELSVKKQQLLEALESNQKELQEIQEIAATQPGSVSEHKLQKLTDQKRRLTIDLEATLNGIRNVCRRGSERITFIQLSEQELHELHELSDKKHQLLETLESNQKELQEIQELVSTQPSRVSELKLQGLTKQRRQLSIDLEATLDGMQNVCHRASERITFIQPSEKELRGLRRLSEKKQQLLESLESNWKELQEIQELAATQPDSVSEYKLQELTEQRRRLTTDLETTVVDIQNICHRASERTTFIQTSEKELHELSKKKQQLLEMLESNWKELQEIQELAVTQPDSVNEHKLQELTEQRRCLATELEATLAGIQNVCHRASERTMFIPPSERELPELLMKKQQLLEKLESNKKGLQDAQALAAAQPGSISDHKLQELIKQRRSLIANLETTMHEIQKAQELNSEGVSVVQPAEGELYELSVKRQEILEKLESVQRELDEASAAAAAQPGSVSEHTLYKLAEEKSHLIEELGQTTVHLLKAESAASEKILIGKPAERELYDLSVKKKELQEKLQSNQKEIDDAQALASIQPGSISEQKLQELAEQRRKLTAELNAIEENIEKVHQNASVQHLQPIAKELNQLSAKKQLLRTYLESNWDALQQAQILAAIDPGSVSENKLQELSEERRSLSKELKKVFQEILVLQQGASEKFLARQPGEDKQKQLTEQRKHLTAELEATVKNIQRAERYASEVLLVVRPSDRNLYELLEKKFELLEDLASNQTELQEIQALVAAQPDSTNENKLQELTVKRRCLSEDLKATVQDIQDIYEIPQSSSERVHVTGPSGKKLRALSEKKQHLLENLESKRKELQEAETLEASQPGSVSAHKLQELNEQRRYLSKELEVTAQDIQKIEHRASEEIFMRRSEEIKLHKLFAWRTLLLEHLESNLKLQEEVQAAQPDNITEKRIQELNEQRKLLAENLEAVVEDVEEMKDYISEKGGIIEYVEKDLNMLYQKKQLLLERLETNLRNLQEAQSVAVTHPSSINEQKVNDLTDERRLLVVGLEAVIQDLQYIQGTTKKKVKKSKKKVLEELCEQKGLLLENLASNLKNLKQAQALAAAQPDSIIEQKVQELIEERRLLSVGLEGIVQNIQNIQDLESSKAEMLTHREIKELSEKRRLYLDNIELNLKDLKSLQTTAVTQPDNEQIVQQLAEKKRILVNNLETIIQDMEQAQNVDLENGLMRRSDEREIHELLVLSTLESKLYELEEIGALSNNQLDVMKIKVHNLKEQRKSSVDRRHIIYPKEYSEKNILDRRKEVVKEFLEQKKHLFSYLQSSIRDLQQKGLLRQEKAIQDRAEKEKEMELNEYLMVVPIDVLQSEIAAFSAKFKTDDEQTAKRRALAAKLEANVKDLQAAFEKVEKIETSREVVIKNIKFEETALDSTISDRRPTSSVSEQRSKILSKEVDLATKGKLTPQPSHKLSDLLPADFSKQPAEVALQEILDYNRTLLPGYKTNLQKTLQLAQQQFLQQHLLAEKFKAMSLYFPQPVGTSRFQEYSLQSSRPVWEANQLTPKGYPQKLNLLKRRLLGPEIKNNIKGGTYSSPTQGLTPLPNQVRDLDSIAICGKGCSPQRKRGTSAAIWQKLRND